MTNVHTVRPTDLAALVGYDGEVYPNESVTRDRVGTETAPHPLQASFEQWFSFATGRHTWISVKGATLRGLVSARRRGAKSAWELDCLVDAAPDDQGVVLSLLDQVAADAGREGAEKIFLRVPAGSGLLRAGRSAGFVPYLSERLLVASERRGEGDGQAKLGLRRWTRADAYATFQLYNRWTPEPVRRIEAATFREWSASRERIARRGAHQTVVEDGGRIAGWLRTAASGEVGRFDLMADSLVPELLDGLIDAALARLREQSRLVALVPEFATGLRERLERAGFASEGEYAVLARRIAKPAAAPELAPVTSI